MDRLLITLNDIRGPLIVAGDFNTWSDKRLIHLDSFAKNMGLKIATLQDDKYIKKLFFKPLDHIYYRELELLEAVVIDTKKISDHNPIYASFTILNHHKSNG
jgi:endonuclease/exonuclease/phosphatase (EEP) superfamily protein YafD